MADLLESHRSTYLKQASNERRQLKKLAAQGGNLMAACSGVGAKRHSEVVAVVESYKAQTRATRQMHEAAKAQQQALLRAVAENEARAKDIQRQLKQAMNDELEDLSRSQAKRQQQLVQLLTVLSNDV